MKSTTKIAWEEYLWQRPFSLETIWELLSHLAAMTPRGFTVFELRASGGKLRYLLATDPQYFGKLHELFHAHGRMQFTRILPMDRRPVTVAHQLKISKPILSLNTDAAIVAIRAGLQALSFTRYQDEAVIQIILGSSLAPSQVSQELPNPHASWLEVFTGTVGKASPETRKSAKDKAEQYRFQCLVRIGISTQHAGIGRLDNILSAFRVLEASGVRIRATRCDPIQINTASIPWQMPLRLSVEELSCFFVASGRRGELCRSTGSAPSSSVASLLVPKTETYRKQADLCGQYERYDAQHFSGRRAGAHAYSGSHRFRKKYRHAAPHPGRC